MIEATGDIEGTMRLPAVLDLAAAEGFLATLLQQIQADKALRLDASGVETLTLSCMQPKNGMHCGRCSKCRERRDAFREAGVGDPTAYRHTPIR